MLRPKRAASLRPYRFLAEIKDAARLKHPYILKLHEAGDARGLLFYSMPYVEGESLRQRLARDRTLPLADALRIAQEVAEAIDHAHRQNIIHRDIKPENILFEEAHALVSDFGIARAISEAGDRRTIPGVVVGTVDYMSPEQEQGRPELDGRTDIYSLGLVLYEMLVGETPGPDSGVDSLTGRRAEVPGLRVTSPDGVRFYRGRTVRPDSLARALNSGTIVSGSVTRSRGVLRASVRLIDGTTGQVLHTRQVMRPYGELFALQDTITADIATFLRQRIGEAVVLHERRTGTSSVVAWETVRQADALREDAREAVRSGDDSHAGKLLSRADSLYARPSALDRRWATPYVR